MEKLERILTVDEIENLLNSINTRYRSNKTLKLMIRVALTTGLRHSSIIDLKKKDIDKSTGKIIVYTKGKKENVSFLQPDLILELVEYWESMNNNSIYCFSTLAGNIIDSSNSRKKLKEAGKKIGINRIHWHLFRTTFLTTVYSQSKDILLTQQLAHHKNISTTQRYVRLSGEDIKNTLINFKY